MPLTPARQHAWDLSPAAAKELQLSLAGQVELVDRFGDIRLVEGIDIGFEQAGKLTLAAVAVLRLPNLAPVEEQVAREPARFPYVPGLLSFREIPAAVAALAALRTTPDLLLCDGQGFAHPRRFGLACHLGWLLDVPSIRVAKSRLIGSCEEPGAERGAATPLHDRGGGDRRRAALANRRQAGVRLHRSSRRPEQRAAADAGVHRPLPPARAAAPCPQAGVGALRRSARGAPTRARAQ